MLESEFYRRHVQPKMAKWGDCCRVENSLGGGTPDVNYALCGYNGWMELKVVRRGLYHFEKFQLPWLKRRYRFTNDVWLLGLHENLGAARLHKVKHLFAEGIEHKMKHKWTVIKADTLDFEVELPLRSSWEELKSALTNT